MTRTQIFGNKKDTRTQIADLPETSVELSEREMRIVTGGLVARLACNAVVSAKASGLMDKTNVVTGQGDWDTDYEKLSNTLAL